MKHLIILLLFIGFAITTSAQSLKVEVSKSPSYEVGGDFKSINLNVTKDLQVFDKYYDNLSLTKYQPDWRDLHQQKEKPEPQINALRVLAGIPVKYKEEKLMTIPKQE